MLDDIDGVFNPSAEKVRRKDVTWSDMNLTEEFGEDKTFDRLLCRNCGGTAFEVLGTDSYETSACCLNCRMYYIVHSG